MTEIHKDELRTLYASLMMEVKERLTAVDTQFSKFKDLKEHSEKVFAAEAGYLQLRRVCELTAIAVLLAHHSLPDFRKKELLKEWNADNLMRQLAKLSDTAFPRKAFMTPMPGRTDGAMQMVFDKEDFFSQAPREQISKIYTECSDKLHTLPLRSFLKKKAKEYSLEFIHESVGTFFNILNQHVIVLPDGRAIEAILRLGSPEPVRCRWLNPGQPSPPTPPKKARSGFRGPPWL